MREGLRASRLALVVKSPPASAGDVRRKWQPSPAFWPENERRRATEEASKAAVYEITKSQT